MLTSRRIAQGLAAPLLVSATLALGACGSNDAKVDSVKQQGTQLQQQGKALQEQARKAAADVKAGRKTADQASAELKRKTDAIEAKAKKAAGDALDVVKNDSNVPDAAKKAIEDAQQQIKTP